MASDSEITIRTISDSEVEQFALQLARGFGGDLPPKGEHYPFSKVLDLDRVFAAFDGNQIAGTCAALDGRGDFRLIQRQQVAGTNGDIAAIGLGRTGGHAAPGGDKLAACIDGDVTSRAGAGTAGLYRGARTQRELVGRDRDRAGITSVA